MMLRAVLLALIAMLCLSALSVHAAEDCTCPNDTAAAGEAEAEPAADAEAEPPPGALLQPKLKQQQPTQVLCAPIAPPLLRRPRPRPPRPGV